MDLGRLTCARRAARRALFGVALLAALTTTMTAQTARPGMAGNGDAAPPEGWDTFSVDIAVTRSRVGKDGASKRPGGQPALYRWQRSQSPTGWKTSVTTLTRTKPVVKSLDGTQELDAVSDLVPARIEDDEDGSPVRFYNGQGKQIELPTSSDLKRRGLPELPIVRPPALANAPLRRPVAGRDWLEAFVAHKGKKDKRRKGLEDKFGRMRGQVRGLDRFLAPSPDGEDEMLVDQEFGVPLEMNRTRKGALVSHTTLGYERTAADTVVRRSLRTEQVIDDGEDAGGRLVADVQFTNLRVERKDGAR